MDCPQRIREHLSDMQRVKNAKVEVSGLKVKFQRLVFMPNVTQLKFWFLMQIQLIKILFLEVKNLNWNSATEEVIQTWKAHGLCEKEVVIF
ncbi:MAG: hypothetical protein R3E08_06260 [Thiotrichaceae bacterium]